MEFESIKDHSYVVFDWDNTLKIYDKEKTIHSRFSKEQLLSLKLDKHCSLFIISAIAPRKLALETLLFEVRKLGLEDVFSDEDDTIMIKPEFYARKGNIVASGYDKAEAFLDITDSDERKDVVDHQADEAAVHQRNDVVFFDDEEVNIHNFKAIVPGSICHHVK